MLYRTCAKHADNVAYVYMYMHVNFNKCIASILIINIYVLIFTLQYTLIHYM